jgi:3-methyladenine DNA glycosylase AlkD
MKTPKAAADEIIQALKKKANPQRAAGAQRYFKEKINFYGMTSVEAREIADEVYRSVQGEWTVREAVELCEILLPDPYYEPRAEAILILLRFKKEFGPEIFSRIKKWLARDYCDNWALVDVLCPEAMETLLKKYPELVEKIKDWTQSPNRWVKRASAVSFITLARRGQYLDDVYEISKRLFPTDDDLIHKAAGWLLREAGKTDMPRLEKFLLNKGASIPRTTLRYAIERFPADKRKRLLEKTKTRSKRHGKGGEDVG